MRKIAVLPILMALVVWAATPAYAQGTIPAGASIVVTLNQSVSSKDAKVGQKVDASVTRDVVVSGKVLIPRGSRANVSVAAAEASGRLSHPAELYLRLNSVVVKGRAYAVAANSAGEKQASHKKRDEVAIGGSAVLGTIIGAVAGGGKGAAIGAAAGAGAGTVGAAATGKKDITFAAESKLNFRLRSSLRIR